MGSEGGRNTAADQIHEIAAAWQEYVDTGDPSVLADHFIDDVVYDPNGTPAIRGKDAVLEMLEEADFSRVENEIIVDELIIGEELAVGRFTDRISAIPDEVDERDQISFSSLDVFQRQDDGSWKQTMWLSNTNQ